MGPLESPVYVVQVAMGSGKSGESGDEELLPTRSGAPSTKKAEENLDTEAPYHDSAVIKCGWLLKKGSRRNAPTTGEGLFPLNNVMGMFWGVIMVSSKLLPIRDLQGKHARARNVPYG